MNDPRLSCLVSAHLDGTLTSEEQLELEVLIRRSAAARQQFWRETELHGLLHEVLHRELAEQGVIRGDFIPRVPLPTLLHVRDFFSQPLALAASLVLLLTLASAWFWQAQRDPARLAAVKTIAEAKVPTTIARLAAFTGEVQVGRAGRQVAVGPGLPLQSGDELRTSDGASARVEYAGEPTWLELTGGTVLALDHTRQGKRLTLSQGSFKADVAPQPTGQPMLCRTPEAEALVLGTIFTLTALSDQTFLTVEKGKVRLSQTDGSALDVNAGQAAVAAPRLPVSNVPYLRKDPPAVVRIPQPWIKSKGLIELSQGGMVTFDFETKPRWTLCHGAFWQAPDPSASGHLCLTGTGLEAKNYAYKAVGPYVSVRPNEVITVTGRARYFNGARLWLQYYLCDEDPGCFGNMPVDAFATSDAAEFVPFRIEFTLPGYADLRYISIILHCSNRDGGQPLEGDTILVDEVHISRGRGAP